MVRGVFSRRSGQVKHANWGWSLASLSSILEITLSSPHAESKQINIKFPSFHAEIKVILEREAASLLLHPPPKHGSLLLI